MNELEKLMEGNKRFCEGRLSEKDVKAARLQTQNGQKPFVTVVACSDSRVVPEYIFDANIGDIFVIRTAGNIVDTITLGSIEYGVEHLNTPLLIVLGHEKCGAVTAACKGGECPPNIQAILDSLQMPVHLGEGDVEKTVVHNAKAVANQIRKRCSVVRKLEADGKLKIIPMKYYFSDGRVEKVE